MDIDNLLTTVNNFPALLHQDESYRGEVFKKLAEHLGAEFYHYIDNPVDYSGPGWFMAKGVDVPILFLPLDVADQMTTTQTARVENLLNVRIKFIDEPFHI